MDAMELAELSGERASPRATGLSSGYKVWAGGPFLSCCLNKDFGIKKKEKEKKKKEKARWWFTPLMPAALGRQNSGQPGLHRHIVSKKAKGTSEMAQLIETLAANPNDLVLAALLGVCFYLGQDLPPAC